MLSIHVYHLNVVNTLYVSICGVIHVHMQCLVLLHVINYIIMIIFPQLSCSHILMQVMYFVMKMLVCYLFSDGMSRSGVFITCMSESERVKDEGAVDIFQSVKAARTQRPHMVNTSVSY